MTLQKFLTQFSFVSSAECRRFVILHHVKINGVPVKFNNLSDPASDHAKIGDLITIGKRLNYKIEEKHFK